MKNARTAGGADRRCTFIVVKTAVGQITVRVMPQTAVKVGEQTGLAVSEAHANWFDAQSGVRMV